MSRALNRTPHAFISLTKTFFYIKMAKHYIYLQRGVVYHKKVVKQAELSPGLIFWQIKKGRASFIIQSSRQYLKLVFISNF